MNICWNTSATFCGIHIFPRILYVKLAMLVVMMICSPPPVQEILTTRKDEDKKGLFLSGAPRLFLGRLEPPKNGRKNNGCSYDDPKKQDISYLVSTA